MTPQATRCPEHDEAHERAVLAAERQRDEGAVLAAELVARSGQELGARLDPSTVTHVVSKTRSYGLEHTFTAPFAATVDEIDLTEGQRVEWFTPQQIESLALAYEDDDVLASFFAARL